MRIRIFILFFQRNRLSLTFAPMFQRGIAILLILCTLTANFSKLFVFAGFALNQKYIAATLCENRDKPWLHCNGRCYLMKKIQQANEKEKAEERQNQKNGFQETFCEAVKTIKFHTFLLRTISTPYRAPAPSAQSNAVFHPPQVA